MLPAVSSSSVASVRAWALNCMMLRGQRFAVAIWMSTSARLIAASEALPSRISTTSGPSGRSSVVITRLLSGITGIIEHVYRRRLHSSAQKITGSYHAWAMMRRFRA